MMRLVEVAELLELAAVLRATRQRLRAGRCPVAGPVRTRLRSAFRTHDRMGSGPWLPGQPLRLLVLRDYANRNQLTAKTYHALSEVQGQVILDPAPGLLRHPEVGPFALKLAFCLSAAFAWQRQVITVSQLASRPARSIRRPEQLVVLAEEYADAQPRSASAETFCVRLAADLGPLRANLNAFLITHPGHPLERLENIVRLLAGRCRAAVVFAPMAAEEFADVDEAADPNTGARVALPRNAEAALRNHLAAIAALGCSIGVPVIPLVIRNDHRSDLATLLPELADLK